MFLYWALNFVFVPQPVVQPRAAKIAPAEDDADRPGDEARVAAVEQEPADAAAPELDDQDQVPTEPPKLPLRLSLGSMDASSGYYLLATLNTQGAAVERLEMTERKKNGRFRYRRVDVAFGYLGYLAPQIARSMDGCEVTIVGPGTPAALAKSQTPDVADGLIVGDVIVALDNQAITTPADLDRLLSATRPGDEAILEIRRPSAEGAEGPSQSLRMVATLTEHPLDLLRLSSDGGPDEVLGNLDRLSCRVTLSQLGTRSITTGQSSIAGLGWIANAIYDHEPSAGEGGVINRSSFTLPLPAAQLGPGAKGPLTITRSYSLTPGSYLIDMDVAIRNDATEPQRLAYRLEGPNGITVEGWWYSTKISPNFFGGAAARDIIWRTQREGHRLFSGYDLLKRGKKQPNEPDEVIFGADEDDAARALKYIGIDAQYFNVAYLPPEGEPSFKGLRSAASTLAADPTQVPLHQERAVNVSFFMDSVSAEVPPGGAFRQPMRMFAGPKVPELLAPHGLEDSIEYGWFGSVSKLLGHVLHGINGLSGNYAIAIILLTVLVRGLLFPVSRKAAIHAQRMQELAPELKKINEKYKDDMEGKLRAQREFQKRVGFNPLAGCLPALLQLPIFIGLYRCLSVDIELRQAAFKSNWQWASNLAGPDMLTYWGDWLWEYLSGRGTGWLGPFFNILPIVVVVLFLVQQKMFMPPPTDEQQELTQKIMMYMTLFMALFFFRVPAGLCIYFISSSLWGIGERIIVKKTIPPPKPLAATAADIIDGTVVATKTPDKKATLADMIRERMNPEPPKALPPSKRKRPPTQK